MTNYLLSIAAANGFLAVTLGAFAAHGLESRLDESALQTFGTAVEYHMYHALALLGVSLLSLHFPGNNLLRTSAWFFMLGILLFCGSLYLLSLTQISWLGAIAPFGGVSFLAAWGSLCWFAVRFGERR